MTAWVARHGLTSDDYQKAVEQYVGQGYRLTDVSGYAANGSARYAAIFEKANGPAWVARHGLTAAKYQAEFDANAKKGYRVVQINGYAVNGEARYAAIFEKSAGPAWAARHGMTAKQYQAEFDVQVKAGLRPVQISGYAVGGEARYAAIFEKSAGPAWVARHGMTAKQYQSEFTNLLYQGYRLDDVCGYVVGGRTLYAAIWLSEGIGVSSIKQIDAKINAYIAKHQIPGLSLAISRQERLVFAKGYGVADQTTGEKVDPSHLFRIASVSKPVTAIAIMRLVQAGQLKLDRKVFGTGAILGTKYGKKAYSTDVKAITVEHLLRHTSGWSNEGQDPMWFDRSMTHADLIGWMLDNRPLKRSPGADDEYLNFGYCVLGRVIEQITGQGYEAYVKGMLAACGITRMSIGADSEAARKPGEVRYHGSGAYSLGVRRFDAHGGWIATPIDLLRLMARVDGFPGKQDILTAVSEAAMVKGSSANWGYGLGWSVDSTWRGHNGSMAGTIANLVRREDGLSFAVTVNTRPAGDKYVGELTGILHAIVASLKDWPSGDLF